MLIERMYYNILQANIQLLNVVNFIMPKKDLYCCRSCAKIE